MGMSIGEKKHKELEEKYVGKVIKIIEMIGEPQYKGKIGTVEYVDDIGQLHGNWGGCGVLYDTDEFEVIK